MKGNFFIDESSEYTYHFDSKLLLTKNYYFKNFILNRLFESLSFISFLFLSVIALLFVNIFSPNFEYLFLVISTFLSIIILTPTYASLISINKYNKREELIYNITAFFKIAYFEVESFEDILVDEALVFSFKNKNNSKIKLTLYYGENRKKLAVLSTNNIKILNSYILYFTKIEDIIKRKK